MAFGSYIKPTNLENCVFQLIERKENSAYESTDIVSCTFRGRIANNMEKKSYRLQKGVDLTNSGVYIICSNLPKDLKDGDHIKYLGQIWQVASIGYYFVESLIVNQGIMSDEYIISRCPKGLTLQ